MPGSLAGLQEEEDCYFSKHDIIFTSPVDVVRLVIPCHIIPIKLAPTVMFCVATSLRDWYYPSCQNQRAACYSVLSICEMMMPALGSWSAPGEVCARIVIYIFTRKCTGPPSGPSRDQEIRFECSRRHTSCRLILASGSQNAIRAVDNSGEYYRVESGSPRHC
jgi:hypothetical protein